jgi:hypothetical protein
MLWQAPDLRFLGKNLLRSCLVGHQVSIIPIVELIGFVNTLFASIEKYYL